MLARIRKSTEEKDQGFTLIELLVVMIIIGILAAIAIPVFLNQRKKAVDSSLKSDIRTVANEMETYFVDNQAYVAADSSGGQIIIGTGGNTVKLSSGNDVKVTVSGSNNEQFRVCGYNAKATANSSSSAFVYESAQGGLQATKGTCS